MRALGVILCYLVLGVFAVFLENSGNGRELHVWSTVMEDKGWKIEEAVLTLNHGVFCRLISGERTLVIEGEELRGDRPAQVKAKLYNGPEAGGNLLGETTVKTDSDLDRFLTNVVERELEALHKTRLDLLFEYQATRRIFLLLESRDLFFSNERERIKAFEQSYPEY